MSDVGVPGTWRLAAHGWRVFVPVVLGNAAVQAVLVAPGVVPGIQPLFVVLAVASVAAVIAAVALVTAEAVEQARAGLRCPRWLLIASTAIWVVAACLAALLQLGLTGVVALGAAIVLPAVASGDSPRAWFGGVRRHPGTAVVWAIATVLAFAGVAVAQFELAFLVSGWPAAALSWTVMGVVTVLVMCGSARLAALA